MIPLISSHGKRRAKFIGNTGLVRENLFIVSLAGAFSLFAILTKWRKNHIQKQPVTFIAQMM